VKLTADQLRAIMPRLTEERAALWLPHLNAAMAEFDITTPARAAMWLANVAHETRELWALVESMSYSADRMKVVWPTRFGRGKSATAKSRADGDALARKLAWNPMALGNYVYGGRLGNRPGTDDGYRHRGRGAPHLTGRDAYARCGEALKLPLLEEPQLLEQPGPAARAAGWFWKSKGMSELADRGLFFEVVRRWVGDTRTVSDRLIYLERAHEAFGIPG
jgi:putative chitinase